MPLKIYPIKNKITFISRQSNSVTLDYDLLIKSLRNEQPEISIKVLMRKLEAGVIKKFSYAVHMPSQMYHIATSKIVIVDGYCVVVSVLNHKKQTKFIQMWHALAAIKKFGYQTIGMPSGSSAEVAKAMYMHKNYDYVLSASKTTAKYFCQGFQVTESQIVYLGLPRIDYLLKEDLAIKTRIKKTYPRVDTRENILYVPTFRKGKKIEIGDFIKKLDLVRFNLIIKLHPLDYDANYSTFENIESVIVDRQYISYDWVKLCDYIVTDYSALGVEASLLNKPVYFYVYDLLDYKKDPGLNIKFEEEGISKNVFNDPIKLANAIGKPYDFDGLQAFRHKYIAVEPVRTYTEDLSQFILALLSNNDKYN